ncbi:ribbon-helix-helix domain-containing protein [Iningainema tapete]|uniref:CopG family transcriptional regulator n=1 Tax=Iningainema tapete BLCC-T55 TaxID=2748662 RepID=A0A8J6Y307_9CYAN|nr:ribbon-helix-helix domain-containing protein [Iningainema tapete]MBD2778633.1 CopG family transcriptional regulator [Iningainema tapete BLCC-T55]
MTTKKRKPLDDALAQDFVYGKSEEPQSEQDSPQEPEPLPASTQQPAKSSIMSQIQQTTTKEPTVRLTVDLPQSMHHKLSMLAAKTGRKKAEIVRLLLDEALNEVNE